MNRRKAIFRILFSGVGGLLIYTGYKSFNLFKKPDFVTLENHKMLIAELSETIIPRTDTPGAKEVGIEKFIIKMIQDCANLQSQNNFIQGLMELNDFTWDKFKKTFESCSEAEKTKTLTHFEIKGTGLDGLAGKAQRRLLGDPFFVTLKKYTVLGYCSSELGATQGLNYDYIPGSYVGKSQLLPGQKAWATQ